MNDSDSASTPLPDESTPSSPLEGEGNEPLVPSNTSSLSADTSPEIDSNVSPSEQENIKPTITPPPSSPHSLPSEVEGEDLATLAHIDFGLLEGGRWLLKVVGGPNQGAEFYMQTGESYLLGTDPHSCDLVFHDTSVSRQHARLSISSDETITIEDLKSRNGVRLNGTPIEGTASLAPQVIVSLGTTSFIIYDREGERHTIVSPILPSIAHLLEESPAVTPPAEGPPVATPSSSPTPPSSELPVTPNPLPPASPIAEESSLSPVPATSWTAYIVVGAIIGLFVLAGLGTHSLFQPEPIIVQPIEHSEEPIKEALKPFPAVHYTFNRTSGGVLLLGHVSTATEKNQLLYRLQEVPFIHAVDDSGIVIDEYVWQEMNSILARNPAWKGITMHSPAPGQFVISGELHTRQQAEQLFSYLSLHFPYLELLQRKLVIDEDIANQVQSKLRAAQIADVNTTMARGELTLTGTLPAARASQFQAIVDEAKHIPGVRLIHSAVQAQTAETGAIDISDRYRITGRSRIGDRYTVVINGRILSEHDELDGMTIVSITPDQVLLEKEGVKYRVGY